MPALGLFATISFALYRTLRSTDGKAPRDDDKAAAAAFRSAGTAIDESPGSALLSGPGSTAPASELLQRWSNLRRTSFAVEFADGLHARCFRNEPVGIIALMSVALFYVQVREDLQ